LCETQGTLFFDVARIIAAKRPRAFLLENVKNLISYVPQHRERILIEGFRERTDFDWDAVPLPEPARAPRLGAILRREDGTEDDPDAGVSRRLRESAREVMLSDKLWAYLQAYAAKHRAKGNGFRLQLQRRREGGYLTNAVGEQRRQRESQAFDLA
jgi:DNA (cytosine-5)-methyltransferase 1